ncbi:hypothetical protein O181_116043 [Austropuccinia psidii MF-1]|uniref:Uncharacterized protein n=1 Tax=Austropuccinia psidii MF-1 TaxID=1389203 RepID=A0A9Q3K7L2_9BASI|nr:hypothetical protein [Austropuccinia psidii MF-1]
MLSTGLAASNIRRYLWSKKDGPFGIELPDTKAPTPDVNGSRQRDVARWTHVGGPIPVGMKHIREIANYPPDPDAEGGDELDGEEVAVVHNSVGHQSSTSPSHPPVKRFGSLIIPRTPRTFQPILSTIPTSLPPASPSSSTARPALIPSVRPSPIHQPRNLPIVTFEKLQPVVRSSRRREQLSPFTFMLLKSFSIGSLGLSNLPEKVQIWKVKIRMLWPGCLYGLIGIVGT